MPRSRHTCIAAILVCSALANGCARNTESRYPDRYLDALEQPAAPIPTDAAARFVAFYESLDQPAVDARFDALYAPDVYFSDTLYQTNDGAALRRHFERIQKSGTRIEVALDDTLANGTDLYLRWRMTFVFEIAGSEKVSRTIGMSLLRFDESGRIRFHQDFWDSAEGFYRHLPGLGWAIDSIAARMMEDR